LGSGEFPNQRTSIGGKTEEGCRPEIVRKKNLGKRGVSSAATSPQHRKIMNYRTQKVRGTSQKGVYERRKGSVFYRVRKQE